VVGAPAKAEPRPSRDAADAALRIATRRGLAWQQLDALDAHAHLDQVEGVDHGWARQAIRERTSAGLAAARARGRHGGRPSVLTGHKLQVAQEMYRSGHYTVAAIAKTLGVRRASIYRHLTRTSS
jgi:DNA invertase Pin-like site-specific DNA recombinase